MKIGQSADKNWGYLIGVYLGDGCVTQQPSKLRGTSQTVFRLNTIDEDFAVATKAALQNFTKRPVGVWKHTVSKSSKPNYALRCGDSNLACQMQVETDHKKKLPDWIWTAEHEVRLALISGLMDSEGFVTLNSNGAAYMGFKSCDVWFDDFVRILNKSGILVGKIGVEKPRKEGYKTPKQFHIKMESWVKSGARFNIARKQARVDDWASVNLRG